MEADWGPYFLENKQVDWEVHHASTFIYIQQDALYDCPCCNHHVSHFCSILVATSSSNPHLSTQTVDTNNLTVASPLQLTSFFRSSLITSNIKDKLIYLLTTILPSTFSNVNTENGEHSYGEHQHTGDGSILMEIDWGPKHNNTYSLHQLKTSHGYNNLDRIPSTTPGAEPPRDTKDSGSARSHSTHLETSSSDRP